MALYPESASYPREEDYRKADGEIDWDAFDLAMDAWAADRSSRQDLAEENLEEIRSFLRDSASVFLGGDDRDNYIYSPLNVYIALGLLAEITAVSVDERFVDSKGKLNLQQAGLLAYAHGEYFAIGRKCGDFGFSVRRKKKIIQDKG